MLCNFSCFNSQLKPPSEVLINIIPEKPSARELVDRSRVLTNVMLENPDDNGPNYVLLLILAEQLQMLRDYFEDDELKRMKADQLQA